MIVEWKVKFVYPLSLLNQPLIYKLIRQFDLLTNIMEAQVTAESGWLVLTVRGENAMVRQGLAWVTEQGVQVEILSKSEEETCE